MATTLVIGNTRAGMINTRISAASSPQPTDGSREMAADTWPNLPLGVERVF